MRYVIVPTIEGGGIIAIIVAVLGMPPKPIIPQPDPAKPVSTSPERVENPNPQKSQPAAEQSSKLSVVAIPFPPVLTVPDPRKPRMNRPLVASGVLTAC